MKERGMIFNGEMVRAILDGRKTQVRVPVKSSASDILDLQYENPHKKYRVSCPFGEAGDRIWVRETFALLGNEDGCVVDWNEDLVKGVKDEGACIYRAGCEQKPDDYGLWSIPDDAPWKPKTKDWKYEGAWSPSSQMKRWASRITLEITGVRVERLQDISQDDASSEGMELTGWVPTYSDPDGGGEAMTPYDNFVELWESIYGPDSWKSNPWVWVIEFKVVTDD